MMCLCGGCPTCLEEQELAADDGDRCLMCGNTVRPGESLCSEWCETWWMEETARLRCGLQIVTPNPSNDESVIRDLVLRTL